MTAEELRVAAEALVERTTTTQRLPRLVADPALLDRAAAMVAPRPEPRRRGDRKHPGERAS
jgi:hypothetical protein